MALANSQGVSAILTWDLPSAAGGFLSAGLASNVLASRRTCHTISINYYCCSAAQSLRRWCKPLLRRVFSGGAWRILFFRFYLRVYLYKYNRGCSMVWTLLNSKAMPFANNYYKLNCRIKFPANPGFVLMLYI